MSFTVINNESVINNINFNSSYEKLIFIILLRYANKGVAYPSLNNLSKLALISRPTVIKALKGLEADGKLIKIQKVNGGEYKNNTYKINHIYLDREYINLLYES